MPVLLGIDGCRTGWVCVAEDTAAGTLEARVIETAALADGDFDVAAIDIPIGLPARGAREAERLARRRLGRPRASSVFPVPIRPALAARSWEEACAITEAADGRRMQRQTYGILPKIREVDALLRSRPALVRRVHEVHPELAFAEWAGAPIAASKKTLAGRAARQRLIARCFGRGTFRRLLGELRGQGVAADDLADALAALWSARRIASGTASRLPARTVRDAEGLPMQIAF